MRIGTYNVLGLTGYPKEESSASIGEPGDPLNSEHFAAVFSGLGCDVLALQEGVAVRTMQRIAGLMRRHLATYASPINWPGHLLSRYPIIESRTYSHFGPDEPTPPFSRTCGVAFVEVNSLPLAVVDVHLHPSDRELRVREADVLQRRLQALLGETDAVVVLGDFNSEVDEQVHRDLFSAGFVNAMQSASGGIQPTMDTAGIPRHSIDHIYLSPHLAPHLTSAEVVRTIGFRHDGPQRSGIWVNSDHLPVIAEIDWPRER